MLTTERLRSLLAAAIGPESGAHIDALIVRGALPPDGAALDTGHIVSALLALLSSAAPSEVSEGHRGHLFRFADYTPTAHI